MSRFGALFVTLAAGAGGSALFASVTLQPNTPGTKETGNINISGTAMAGSIVGMSSEPTGIAYGGDFRSISTSGRGVLGNASAATGTTYGGLFQSASSGGRGVAGLSSATSGTAFGGFFSSVSPTGRGVYGQATATSGLNYGVYGRSNSPAGYGGYFEGNLGATGVISGNGSGVTDINATNITTGLIPNARLSTYVAYENKNNAFVGENQFANETTFFGSNAQLLFESANTAKLGMDNANNLRLTSGTASFVMNHIGTSGFGFPAHLAPLAGPKLQVYNEDTDNLGSFFSRNGFAGGGFTDQRRAGFFEAGGTGPTTSITAIAKSTTSSSIGIEGQAFGTGLNYGIYGSASGGTSNYAGYFSGVLYASTLTGGIKSFLIDHPMDPANKFLEHSSIESDERLNIYRGVVVTDARGYADVLLPDWFSSLNEDIQYQLTVVDSEESDTFAQVKVAKQLKDGQFTIRSSVPRLQINWQVSGRRHDPTSMAHPMQVEREKSAVERGRYLAPEAFGKDRSFSLAPQGANNLVQPASPDRNR